MEININNYEEYFLLYADNELSAHEKRIVEAFVKQHPDLEEEFLLIRQSVIKPDAELKLENKSFLFKETDTFINLHNYQEIFVLYNDDELSRSQKEQAEVFLSQNPSLSHEFDLLQKTKLQPDNNIVFPNKRLLFKKEEDGKIIPLNWWKTAAAAVLLGAGLFAGIKFIKSNNRPVPAIVKIDTVRKVNKVNTVPADIKPVEAAGIVAENNTHKQESRQAAQLKVKRAKSFITIPVDLSTLAKVKNQNQPVDLPVKQDMAENNKKENVDVVIKEGKPQVDSQPANKTNNKDNSVYKVDNSVYTLPGQNDIATNDKAVMSDALPASYQVDENAEYSNYAFYNVTEEKFNKSKLGGFLRKVKRIVERKSPFYKTKDKSEMAVK